MVFIRLHHRWPVLAVALVSSSPVHGTWSIVLADSSTREVAVGTVTCLTTFDLAAIVPVIVVGEGAGACQAAGDFDGIRRPIIFNGLMNDVSPQDILVQLSQVTGHQSRQYGITDTNGQMVTFSGSQTMQWTGGVVGSQGTMVYAIQGNVLTGPCVVPAIEQAILNTNGDLPQKLMEGMQAAKQMGGDGRCSCFSCCPTICGCPPPNFTKAGHIGAMIVARVGDTDDPVCNAAGCADGHYFMRLNVPFQSAGAPDPVIQLKGLFATWRQGLVGRPDAVQSDVQFDPPLIPPNGVAQATMEIHLLDWQELPISVPIQDVTVQHAPGSAGLSAIGPVVDEGGGVFSVTLTSGTATGIDRFVVSVQEAARATILAPNPAFQYFSGGDLDGDGVVGILDFLALLGLWGPCPPPCPGDLDGDGAVGITDFLALLGNWS
jgi:uncharacterized Ntn-hydrolase superfamily protein